MGHRERWRYDPQLVARCPPGIQQPATVARTVCLAEVRLGRISKTIQRTGDRGEQRYQNHANSNNVTSQSRAEYGGHAETELQQQRMQHDIMVKRQQATEISSSGSFRRFAGNSA